MRRLLSAAVLGLALMVSPAAAQTTRAPQRFANLGDFKLVSGQTIRACKLGYRTIGKLNAAKSNAILIPTAFTQDSSIVVDPANGMTTLFDDSRYFVIAVDALGDGVSCSPSTSTLQHGAAFPRFTIEDMVNAEHALVTRTLGISHLYAVIGDSMAGMQTFQWVVSYPNFMEKAIPIVGTPQPTSEDLLLFHTLEASLPNLTTARLIMAMNVFTPHHRVAHTSRSEFPRFYKAAVARSGVMNSDDWRAQIEAMLADDVARGGALSTAAAKVRARMLIISALQDHAAYPGPALEFARLVHAQTLVLHGDCGHLAPFCEADKVKPAIDAFLRGSVASKP